jgi:hypothetical protein
VEHACVSGFGGTEGTIVPKRFLRRVSCVDRRWTLHGVVELGVNVEHRLREYSLGDSPAEDQRDFLADTQDVVS